MFRNTQTSLRIRRPPLCLLTLVANADLTSESGERRLFSQPIGRVTAHNPVNCILVILTPSCEYPVDRGCRRSSARVKSLFTRSLLPARVLNSGPHDSQAGLQTNRPYALVYLYIRCSNCFSTTNPNPKHHAVPTFERTYWHVLL